MIEIELHYPSGITYKVKIPYEALYNTAACVFDDCVQVTWGGGREQVYN